MRRLSLLIICLIMTFSMIYPVFADLDAGTVLMIEQCEANSEEIAEVEKAVRNADSEWDRYLGSDRDKIIYQHMYRVYYQEMKDMVSAYTKNGSFASNITDKYYWVVPYDARGTEVQVIRSEQTENGWDLRRGTNFAAGMAKNYEDIDFSVVGIYNSILKHHPTADKKSIRIVFDETMNAYLVNYVSEGKEYIIPYFTSRDITWISNAVSYEAGEFIDLVRMNEAQDSDYIVDDVAKKTPEKIYLNYIVLGTIVVIFVAAIAVSVAKYKKDK